MCGILGVIKKSEKIKVENFCKLNDLQSHRGPDGKGFWVNDNGNIALGHRRLSIIDLDQGAQPMFSYDKHLVISFSLVLVTNTLFPKLNSRLVRSPR